MNVGFIGLGLMGQHMAVNISKHFDVYAATRTPGKASAVCEGRKGMHAMDSASDVARQCQVIILCVTDSPDVVAVAHGGLFDSALPGTVIVDMSTISPTVTQELAAEARAKNLHWLDAPVSGGTKGAADATLTIMVGGAVEALEKARPVLECMGKRITHFGESGMGQNAKLANQIMVGLFFGSLFLFNSPPLLAPRRRVSISSLFAKH